LRKLRPISRRSCCSCRLGRCWLDFRDSWLRIVALSAVIRVASAISLNELSSWRVENTCCSSRPYSHRSESEITFLVRLIPLAASHVEALSLIARQRLEDFVVGLAVSSTSGSSHPLILALSISIPPFLSSYILKFASMFGRNSGTTALITVVPWRSLRSIIVWIGSFNSFVRNCEGGLFSTLLARCEDEGFLNSSPSHSGAFVDGENVVALFISADHAASEILFKIPVSCSMRVTHLLDA